MSAKSKAKTQEYISEPVAEPATSEINLYVQTNNFKDPAPYEMLKMFYKGAFENTIGLMEALNEETQELEYLIVGLSADPTTGNTAAIPIAKVFSDTLEANKYSAPDGRGGYSRDSAEKEDATATIQ